MLNVKRNKVGNSKVFRLVINQYLYAIVLVPLVIGGILYAYFKTAIPTQRVNDPSQLVMQGDLNNDRIWDSKDKIVLKHIVATPWDYSDAELADVDVNHNSAVDEEDIRVLDELYSAENVYELPAPAPRVREFFRYQSVDEFVQRPAYVLEHSITADSPVAILDELRTVSFDSPYLDRLSHEIQDEAVRFGFIYAARKDQLSGREKWFLNREIEIIQQLYEVEDYYDLLLHLILLTESGETLSTASQSVFIKNVRVLAEDLRGYLLSPEYQAFRAGEATWQDVFANLDRLTTERVKIKLNLETMEPARDLAEIKNYVDRAEWQVYKSTSSEEDFRQLVSYAQKDRRYLRAVSNTSERHADTTLENHNLPMMLLFSKAMKIVGNDKKAAVGLLDEAIRIPFFWVKSLPDRLRPSSVALEHFLLPGNMEDGSDKSRHWNVFGGLSLYRTPEESLKLAFQREVEDVRETNYTPEAMTEFIRDMIANLNGIYHVVSYGEG
ncbi:MAG: hypothetical protein QNK19_04035 [Xanthomonadales bacterium]|nr:hypothetical protein [Xanthomonadales bacterium]